MMTRLLCRFQILGALLVGLSMIAHSAEPPSGGSVYVLQMRAGFDHFLANQITQSGILTVVTDPALAQYVLTDAVGSGFELTMESLYPKPKPEEQDSAAADQKKEAGGVASIAEAYTGSPRRTSSFSRSDGTYFLVNRESRIVVWSTFYNHRDSRNEAMDKDAAQVVKRLQKFMKQAAATEVPAP